MAYKKLNSGELNQKIALYSFVDVPDGAGGIEPMAVLYWSTNAKVEFLRSISNLQANQEKLKPVIKFTFRDRQDKDISQELMVKYRDGWFTISTAIVDFPYVEAVQITAVSADIPKRIEETT